MAVFDNEKKVKLPPLNPVKVSNRSIFDGDNSVSIGHTINDEEKNTPAHELIDCRYDNYNIKTTYSGDESEEIVLNFTDHNLDKFVPVTLKLGKQRDVEGDILELQYEDKNGKYISGKNVGNEHILEIPVETEKNSSD